MKPWGVLGALALASVTSAQGSLGGDQLASCGTNHNFQYLGCYPSVPGADHAGFSYEVSPFNDNPKYYPGFTRQLTVEMCVTACRGHGFKYAGLYAKYLCFCSTTAPATTATTIDQCHRDGACQGDPNEFCGSGSATDVYVDPSLQGFPPNSQAGNYQYLGCFTTANPGDFYNNGDVSTIVSGLADCFTRCSNAGYAYAGMFSSNQCACGTDFEVGQQAQSEASCNNPCNLLE